MLSVYTQEVLGPIHAIVRGLSEEPQMLYLSAQYMDNAKKLSRIRAVQAAYRLAEVWRRALKAE